MKTLFVMGTAAAILVCGLLSESVAQSSGLWIESLPLSVRQSILWTADLEEGSLSEWTRSRYRWPGSGVFLTGEPEALAEPTQAVAHSGDWSVQTIIHRADRARNGNRAVRLMVWTDRAWDNGGKFFPETAYYSVWMYFPHVYNPNKYPPWDPGDGGWWNVFQFKSNDHSGESQPVWTLNVGRDDDWGTMHFYLYSKFNLPYSFHQDNPVALRARKWIHIEAFYQAATDDCGRIAIWQDGRPIYDVDRVVTSLGGESGEEKSPIWGIGNYTDHVTGDPAGEGTATVYFDDAVVSSARVSQVLP